MVRPEFRERLVLSKIDSGKNVPAEQGCVSTDDRRKIRSSPLTGVSIFSRAPFSVIPTK